MNRTLFLLSFIVIQALISISILYSVSKYGIDLLGLLNFYDKQVSLMVEQTIFDATFIKNLINIILVCSMVSLLINGLFYMCYKSLRKADKVLLFEKVEDLLRELLLVSMATLTLGCTMIIMAPFINSLLTNMNTENSILVGMVIGQLLATSLAIIIVFLFSKILNDFIKKIIIKVHKIEA